MLCLSRSGIANALPETASLSLPNGLYQQGAFFFSGAPSGFIVVMIDGRGDSEKFQDSRTWFVRFIMGYLAERFPLFKRVD